MLPKTGNCNLEMNLIIIFLKKVLNLLFTLEEKYSLTVTKIFAFGRQIFIQTLCGSTLSEVFAKNTILFLQEDILLGLSTIQK